MELVKSLRKSTEVVVLAMGPMLLALLAVIALPLLHVPAMAPAKGVLVFIAEVTLLTLPVSLLKDRLAPSAICAWELALPIPAALRWLADGAVALVVLGPAAIACLVSLCFWLYQWPTWLQPHWLAGSVLVLMALLAAWLAGTAIIARRRRARPGGTLARLLPPQPPDQPVFPGPSPWPRTLMLWRHLFWLPFWRQGNLVGLRQVIFFLAGATTAVLWSAPTLVPALPAPVLGFATSGLQILLTDRGDKSISEQLQRLSPFWHAWPLHTAGLARVARILAVFPALMLLALLAGALAVRQAPFNATIAAIYLGLSGAAHIAIACTGRFGRQARVVMLFLTVLVLTAIGSELWN